MKTFKLIFAQHSVVFELQHYKLHSEKVEALLEKEMHTLRREHDEMTKDWSDYDRAEFFERSHDDYWELGEKFPEIHRSSNVISVYSVLENNLNNLCYLYSKITESDIELKDFGETDIIKRAKVYLTKVAKVDFPDEHDSWKEILKIQQIRNKLVHAQGDIPTGNSELIGYIKNNAYLELTDISKLSIKRGFVEHCTRVFTEFFEEFFTRNK